MQLQRRRDNVFSVTLTATELSALIAAARMAADAMEQDQAAPREAQQLLRRILRDYDQALTRHQGEASDG